MPMSNAPPPLPPNQPQQPPPVMPYAAPVPHGPYQDGLLCPRCGQYAGQEPKFTWWGGAIGHKIIGHVKCKACGFGFNKKTGKSTTGAIVIYSIVANVVIFALLILLYTRMR